MPTFREGSSITSREIVPSPVRCSWRYANKLFCLAYWVHTRVTENLAKVECVFCVCLFFAFLLRLTPNRRFYVLFLCSCSCAVLLFYPCFDHNLLFADHGHYYSCVSMLLNLVNFRMNFILSKEAGRGTKPMQLTCLIWILILIAPFLFYV